MTIKEDVVEVKTTAGDAHLDGEDFGIHTLAYGVSEFKRENKKGAQNFISCIIFTY